MTQTKPNDKSTQPDLESGDDEPSTRDLVEAVAAAYFDACRKIASVLNRKKSSRR